MMMPDLIEYWLTGEKACEYTNATTTQLYDLDAADWAWELRTAGHPRAHLPRDHRSRGATRSPFAEVRQSGAWRSAGDGDRDARHRLGRRRCTCRRALRVHLQRHVVARWGRNREACHHAGALRHNFTNEGGFGGGVRLLRNGWGSGSCRSVAGHGGGPEATTLTKSSSGWPRRHRRSALWSSPTIRLPVHAGDMPARLRDFCAKTGQDLSEEPGVIARCVFEGPPSAQVPLGPREGRGEVSGQRAEKVRRGRRGAQLLAMPAHGRGYPPSRCSGPGRGDGLQQRHGPGLRPRVRGVARGDRDVVRSSVRPDTYYPEDEAARWEEAFGRFSELMDARLEGVVME